MIYEEYGTVQMIRTRDWKYVHQHSDGSHELYDLMINPNEWQNLVEDRSQATLIAELKSMMNEWVARYIEPARDGIVDDGTDPSNQKAALVGEP